MATLEEILKHDSMRHVSNSKKSDGLRCPARLEGMLGFELDRTVYDGPQKLDQEIR